MKTNMKKILTIGSGMQDIFIQYNAAESLQLHTKEEELIYTILRAGRKIEAEKLLYFCGGGAANSAVSFARLGFESESFFKIGTDQEGTFIINTLTKQNVSTKHCIKTEQSQTGKSFIIPELHGNQAVIVYRGANLTMTEQDIPKNAIAECDQLYITSLSGPVAQLFTTITGLAKTYGKLVAANPGTSQLLAGPELLKKALSHIDILILNSYEAQLLMTTLTVTPQRFKTIKTTTPLPSLLTTPLGLASACFTLPLFFQEVHSHGPQVIVVTNGAEGVYASDTKTIFFHPSIATTITSSLGAGDAFGSCFVGSLLHGDSIDNALRAGIINSSSVIQHLGTQNGLLTYNEIQDKVRTLDIALLQKFKNE